LKVLRPLIKLFFLTKAAVEIGRERVEDYLDTLTARADEYKSSGTDRVQEAKEYAKNICSELSQKVWQRSESLENQVREKIRRQVADFSLGALGDTSEINELRAEIATLRAEISELKSMRATV
jgi:polyhydroxyalkanoate synthesis regulator phasin